MVVSPRVMVGTGSVVGGYTHAAVGVVMSSMSPVSEASMSPPGRSGCCWTTAAPLVVDCKVTDVTPNES